MSWLNDLIERLHPTCRRANREMRAAQERFDDSMRLTRECLNGGCPANEKGERGNVEIRHAG